MKKLLLSTLLAIGSITSITSCFEEAIQKEEELPTASLSEVVNNQKEAYDTLDAIKNHIKESESDIQTSLKCLSEKRHTLPSHYAQKAINEANTAQRLLSDLEKKHPFWANFAPNIDDLIVRVKDNEGNIHREYDQAEKRLRDQDTTKNGGAIALLTAAYTCVKKNPALIIVPIVTAAIAYAGYKAYTNKQKAKASDLEPETAPETAS